MKLLTYQYYTGTQVGVLSEDGKTVYPVEGYDDMNQVIDTVSMNELRRVAEAKMGGIPFEAVKLLAPIPHPKQDIICLGVNYMDHAAESARFKKEKFDGERPYAVYFSKRVDEAVPCGGVIPSHSDIVDSLDYEAELAVIIGRDAKNVSRECAFDYVFGYTIFNDVSARTIQNRHKQWYFGKSMDGFCPMGPWIVTADEIEAPPELGIRSRVNGELRQQSSTGLLIFDVAHVIHELSQGMTLRAGTVISMGTPAGVGMGFDPPKYLKPGDVVECEIDGIGTLKNTVR
ncbi:fumarylacetoacetate hydrolase family protein [Anaerotruncus rubiinfantis]|uniref:fumarylacetoacetate hydrolase family protein n=1 Tax=Anaerotruncus rubiinfantis TaxID=1720200 RepID=UPI0011CA0EDA|nr:fumarylacetoacetate hydrolase family protein [Anaerotruncus rubiinfantis]